MVFSRISTFVKYNRQRLGFTQSELALKAGVGLRFIRELEQGKETLRLDKVNQVLSLFGHTLAPTTSRQLDPYSILLTFINKTVIIQLKNKETISGKLIGPIYNNDEISSWRLESDTLKNVLINHSDIQEIK